VRYLCNSDAGHAFVAHAERIPSANVEELIVDGTPNVSEAVSVVKHVAAAFPAELPAVAGCSTAINKAEHEVLQSLRTCILGIIG
jgi:hypothetical protein